MEIDEGLPELVLSLKKVDVKKIRYEQIMVRPLLQKLNFLTAQQGLPHAQVINQAKNTLMRTFSMGFRDTTRVA